jgi:hypothetical protein
MQMEIELCAAAGCDVRNLDPVDCYLIAGAIISDQLFRGHEVSIEEIEALSPADARGLRERIHRAIVPPINGKS